VRKNASSSRFALTSLAVVAGSLLACMNAGATVYWDGDASKGTGVFKGIERNASATVSVVTDSTQGKVWKFYKPTGSNRSEARGAKGFDPTDGKTFYIGWRYKLTGTASSLNAIFQTHAYGGSFGSADQPVVLKPASGHLQFRWYGYDSVEKTLWDLGSNPTSTWVRMTVRMHIGRGDDGWVELWYNGQQQTLKTGGTRFYGLTLSGDTIEPKWGVYGSTSVSATNYVDALKIASTYSEAAP
jgi:hypothetical protein